MSSELNFYDVINDSIIRVEIDLRPYPEIRNDSVLVMWNNIDSVYDYLSYYNNLWYNWEPTVNGDTIELNINVFINNEIRFRRLRFLDRNKNNLPGFISYNEEGWIPFVYYDTLKTGLIKIDSWDKNGIISGGIFTNNWSKRNEYLIRFFWADLSE